jgi:hypothetical protein
MCGIYEYLPVDPFDAIQMRTGAYKSRHSSYVTFFNESLFVSILRLRSGGKERYD